MKNNLSVKPYWQKITTLLRTGIDGITQNTHQHYLSFLPSAIGLIPSLFLRLFFKGIRLNRDQIDVLKDLPQDAIVIYAVKHKSYFDYMFYHTVNQRHGLPVPEYGFGYRALFWQPVWRLIQICVAHLDHLWQKRSLPNPYSSGYLEEKLLEGRAAIFHLIEKKGFYLRFVKSETDPVQFVIEMQKHSQRPFYIVPLIIFYDKNPHRDVPSLLDMFLGTKEKPGCIRRLATLFMKPGKVFAEISAPVNVGDFLQKQTPIESAPQVLAQTLRGELLLQFNRHRQSITGPVLKSREELKENILTGAHLQTFMEKHADENKMPIAQVRKHAHDYLDEIAANYRMGIIRVAAKAVQWIIHIIFDGYSINYEMLARVKTISRKGPLVFIPCHKSHIDYLILSFILFINNMPCPHVAAGKNLSFWPLGPIFRGAGAFFIRRTFKGAPLYSRIFSAYMYKLLEEGFNIEFFIEGGRSRTGKLILPKLGLLSILLEAYQSGACDDLIFVPTYIGYDRVLEESAYVNELEGGKKEPENLKQVISASKFLRKRYGRIYINLHEPFSLKELLERQSIVLKDLIDTERKAFYRHLGHRIINAINTMTVVTPFGLSACAVLSWGQEPFDQKEFRARVDTYLKYLVTQKVQLSDTLIIDEDTALDKAFDAFLELKLIETATGKDTLAAALPTYRVNSAKRILLEYYKNNCVAFFIPAAFTALSILARDAFQFVASDLRQHYIWLQEFFKYEFAYDIDQPPEYFVRKSLKAFIDDAAVTPHATLPDTYNITSAGFRTLKLFSRLIKVYFESYWVVLNHLTHQTDALDNPKAQIKKIQSRAAKMFKNNEITLNEAISKITFQNGLTNFQARGIQSAADEKEIHYYAHELKEYLNLFDA
jgi:glycerol-3-phosphate O-acyltransferase